MRLVTRGDLDGLTCAVLLCLNEQIDTIKLIHPQEITDDKVEITGNDIIANLPHHENCAMWFDHHLHTATASMVPADFKGAFGRAPSAAGLIYDYYGGEQEMPLYAELVHETDRLDSANLTPQDVLRPEGFIQLGFTIDGRTGFGAFEQYFQHLVGLLLRRIPVDKILADPQVADRCQRLKAANETFRDALLDHSEVEKNVVVTDFRGLDEVPVGNRFLIYALYPEVNVSVRLQWGPRKAYPILTIGHSIFSRTCNTNAGELAARYGGGGHRGAGSIPLMDDPDQQIQMIVGELKSNG